MVFSQLSPTAHTLSYPLHSSMSMQFPADPASKPVWHFSTEQTPSSLRISPRLQRRFSHLIHKFWSFYILFGAGYMKRCVFPPFVTCNVAATTQ